MPEKEETRVLSKPQTEKSPGTVYPSFFRASMMPMATKSLVPHEGGDSAGKMAVSRIVCRKAPVVPGGRVGRARENIRTGRGLPVTEIIEDQLVPCFIMFIADGSAWFLLRSGFQDMNRRGRQTLPFVFFFDALQTP